MFNIFFNTRAELRVFNIFFNTRAELSNLPQNLPHSLKTYHYQKMSQFKCGIEPSNFGPVLQVSEAPPQYYRIQGRHPLLMESSGQACFHSDLQSVLDSPQYSVGYEDYGNFVPFKNCLILRLPYGFDENKEILEPESLLIWEGRNPSLLEISDNTIVAIYTPKNLLHIFCYDQGTIYVGQYFRNILLGWQLNVEHAEETWNLLLHIFRSCTQ